MQKKEGESFSRVFGNKYNLTKKENNLHLISEDLEIQPLFLKVYLNVKVCVSYRQTVYVHIPMGARCISRTSPEMWTFP